MFFTPLANCKAPSLQRETPRTLGHSLSQDWLAQWPSSVGALLWRADLILCGDGEASSSVSDPEGSRSPSWDPVSPTSSRRNLNFDKKRCQTKYQPHTISSSTISSVATNTNRPTGFSLKPNLCLLTAVFGIRAVVYPSRGVPKRRADFRHRESFCWKPP